MEFFCEGINQPLMSWLRGEGPRSSLCPFMDYALLCVSSLFTVGVAEEERDIVPVTEMCPVTADRHESSHVTADCHESSQVTADRRESSHS